MIMKWMQRHGECQSQLTAPSQHRKSFQRSTGFCSTLLRTPRRLSAGNAAGQPRPAPMMHGENSHWHMFTSGMGVDQFHAGS